MKETKFDVAIAGGGLIGVSMAQALREYSGKVALIDRYDLSHPETFNPPLRAIALSDSSFRIFSTLGVWEHIADLACSVQRIAVSERHHFGVTNIDAARENLPAIGYVVTNTELLRALYRANDLQERIDMFPSTVVTRVQRGDQQVDVFLKNGGGNTKLSARLLILADGGGSSLAADLGFEKHSKDYRQTAAVIPVKTRQVYDGKVFERFCGGELLAVLPLDNRNNRVAVWIVSDSQYQKVERMSEDSLLGALRERIGSHLDIEALHAQHFAYPLRLEYISEPAGGRVAVLGDSAHKIHPIAGQGFNLSLRDMAFLAERIAGSKDAGSQELLQDYCRARRDDVSNVIRFTDGLSRLVMLPSRTAAISRGAGLAVFNMFPPMRRALVRRSLGLTPPFSRFASGVSLNDR